ncbi:MAG: hypothetical protein RLZZ192_626 [Pseudomonadota bacterium]|jgi:hypothetical protein
MTSWSENHLQTKSLLISVGLGVITLWLLVFAFYMPVYPDEINWRVIFTRIREQGGRYFHYTFSCRPDLPVDVPWYVVPQLYFLSVYRDLTSFVSFRVPQLFFSVVYLLGVARLFSRTSSASIGATALFTASVFVLFNANVGVVWLLSSRPEAMLLAFVGLLLWCASGREMPRSSIAEFLMCVCWMIVCVAHPKAVYFAPLLLGALYLRRRSIFSLTSTSVVVSVYALAISRYAYLFIINCPDEPALERMYFAYNANPLLIFTQPQAFFDEFQKNFPGQVSNLLSRAPAQLMFSGSYDIGYLPGVKVTAPLGALNNFLAVIFYGVLIFIFISPFLLLRRILSVGLDLASLVWLIGSIAFVLVVFNRTTNSYEIHFWMSLVGPVLMARLVAARALEKTQERLVWFAVSSVTLGLLFVIAFHSTIYTKLRVEWSGVNSGPNTSRLFFSSSSIAKISDFSRSTCGGADYLFFDDRTFMAIDASPRSRPYTYFMVPFTLKPNPTQEAAHYLDRFGSVHFVGNCAFESELPENMKNVIGRLEELNICCFVKR